MIMPACLAYYMVTVQLNKVVLTEHRVWLLWVDQRMILTGIANAQVNFHLVFQQVV
jgi:hypothetical protein